MKLVTNHGVLSHQAAIAEVLTDAVEATLAVAFLKKGGAQFVEPLLEALLSQGGQATAFVGTDFFLTEPDALGTLLDLGDRYPAFELFMGRRAGATFHPKVYTSVKGQTFQGVIGSANLTGGALNGNDETSLLIDTATASDLHVSFQEEWVRLRASGRFLRLDRLALKQYRRAYKAVQARRKALDAAIAEAAAHDFDLQQLDALLARYEADADAMVERDTRAENRILARRVQHALARMETRGRMSASDRASFEDRVRDLMSGKGDARHLWPSDAIFRQGTKTLKQPREMIDLFALGERASKMAPADGFDLMRVAAQKIDGAGVNMITEILSTFAPDRYAVLNGNTASALRSLGFEAPVTLTVGALRGQRYAEVVLVIDELRERIGAADFPETDAFLNWLYQRL